MTNIEFEKENGVHIIDDKKKETIKDEQMKINKNSCMKVQAKFVNYCLNK